MGPIWGDRTQVSPMLAPQLLLSGLLFCLYNTYRYGWPSVLRFTWNLCTSILEKDQSKHFFFFNRLMEYSDITWQSHILFPPAAVITIIYSIHWNSRLCMMVLMSKVSTFMILMTSLWHFTMLRYVSRYYCIATVVSRYESHHEAPISLHPYWTMLWWCMAV